MHKYTIILALILMMFAWGIVLLQNRVEKLVIQVNALIEYHNLPTVKKSQPKPKKREEAPHLHDGTPHKH